MSTPYATGCSQICNDGRDCTCTTQPCQSAAPEGGNIWFAEPEPPEPMTTCEAFWVLAILSGSAATVIFLLINVAERLFPNIFN